MGDRLWVRYFAMSITSHSSPFSLRYLAWWEMSAVQETELCSQEGNRRFDVAQTMRYLYSVVSIYELTA